MTEMQKEIAALCKQLKLSARMAERAMEIEGSSNQEYLIRLFDSEVKSRRDARIASKLRSANIPYAQSFEDFDSSEVRFPDELSLAQFRDLKFFREKKNILMYGNTGTGKTMLSICIAIEACMNDIGVRYYRTADLINRLTEARKSGRLSHFKEKLNGADILILCEFGCVVYDVRVAQLLFDRVSEIDERKVLILNTNKEFSEWQEILIDPKMTKAMIGRVTHHCHLILFPGEDWRFKHSSLSQMFKNMENENDH